MRSFTIAVLFLLISANIIYSQSSYQNVLISQSGGPNEVSICINPKNLNQVVAGANISFYYYSTNGGANWTSGNLSSSTYGVWGDPIIMCDTLGAFYFFHLSDPPGSAWIDRIVCQKSTTGGATWNDPGSYMGLNTPKAQDKHGIVIDWTHGTRGNWIYSTWTEFDNYGTSNPSDSSRILFSRSTDAGLTWSAAMRISRRGGNCVDEDYTTEGAVPAVGPNGNLYVAWVGPISINNFGIFFDKSTDGGTTWLPDDIIAGTQPGGWDYVVPGIYRNNGLPQTVCDISTGPYSGSIYINYTDSVGAGDHDVKIIRSTNGGTNWSAPIRVNDDAAGKEQFFTWMTIDQVTGYLYCVFYDRRNYTNSQTDVFLARSTNGGTTWVNMRISESPFTPNNGTFFGDYNGITAHNGKVRPIWTRLAGSALSIWTALIEFPVSVEPISTEVPQSFNLYQNFPNPFNPVTKIRFDIPDGISSNGQNSKLVIYDALGKEVQTLVDQQLTPGTYEVSWDASSQASGVYYYSLTCGSTMQTKKLVLTK
jgi:hypothetical protein